MNRVEFKKLCSECFIRHGFKEQNGRFYRHGQSDIFCAAEMQRSDYSEAYYINFSFLTKSECAAAIEPYFFRRVKVKSVSMHSSIGLRLMTDMIIIADYTPEEILNYLNAAFDEWIMPTLTKGAGFVLRHKGDFIFPHIDPSLTDLPHLKMIIKKE
ncbi:MAG: DUF4304 domain-containing protein [Christensenellales bacterium]